MAVTKIEKLVALHLTAKDMLYLDVTPYLSTFVNTFYSISFSKVPL